MFEGHQPLSFAESPTLSTSADNRCLKFDFIRVNNNNRFRIARNSSGDLITLKYFNDILFQNFWIPLQVPLPAGRYSVVFESQSDSDSNSATSLAFDNVKVFPRPCYEGKIIIEYKRNFIEFSAIDARFCIYLLQYR